MSEYLEIPREFLEEEQKLCQTRPKLHNSGTNELKGGGPYPSHMKKTRRDRVYKLHFEYGYSARKISTMIKANRNTVNSDISFWYGQMQKDDDKISRVDWMNKIFCRLESRRVRLMERLEKTESLGDSLLIEKMINEIDTKTMQIIIKLDSDAHTNYDRVKDIQRVLKRKRIQGEIHVVGSDNKNKH